jgi:hypothetical protein
MVKLANKIMYVGDASGIGSSGIHGDPIGETKAILRSVPTTMVLRNSRMELVC